MIQIGVKYWKNEVTIAYRRLDELVTISFLYLPRVTRILPRCDKFKR